MTSTISLLSTLVILVSCNNYNQPSDSASVVGNNKHDTVKIIVATSSKSATYPIVFEAAFNNDTKVIEGDISYNFYKINIGKIKIESGRLIACDPIVMHDASPFTQNFQNGDFPVHLAIAKTHNDERVAFSRIVFSDKRVAKWKFALLKGQKPTALKDSSFYCYGVDSGTGIFVDSIASKFFNEKGHSEWKNAFVAKAEKDDYKGHIYNFDGHNLAAFSTGYGDGCYATYIGFDSGGNVCQVLTDFGLVEWWKTDDKK